MRKQKLEQLREEGKIPYADRFERTHTAAEALKEGGREEGAGGSGGLREVPDILASLNVKGGQLKDDKLIKLCGRLMTFREHGKLTFAHLQDFSGKIQICFMHDFIGDEHYKFLKKIDVADFIGVSGELFKTRHGEITLLVYHTTILSKALRPLPEKWHGVKDQETIYRQRYLDTTMNRTSMDRFIFRSDLVKVLREFYWSEGFTELETPVLENVSSGAASKPFLTHHNALDIDVYLRIAGGELWQKMALVGGFEKTFEVARCFRNEGMDPSHLQEFTMIEHYCAFWDYEDNMKFTERMFEFALKKLLGTTKVKVKDRNGNEVEVDFKAPWPRVCFTKIIEADCGIDVLKYDEAAHPAWHGALASAAPLLKEIKKKGLVLEDAENLGYGNLVDALYKKVSRPKLIQPTFVINHPLATKPLARKSDKNPRLCDTFQLLVNTWEVINAYSEIVDPTDQRARFEKQAEAKAGGDEEAMAMNEEYLLAMEHGMPCASGWGMGVDRLVTLLTGQENLKDAVLFPLLRPLEEQGKKAVGQSLGKAGKVEGGKKAPVGVPARQLKGIGSESGAGDDEGKSKSGDDVDESRVGALPDEKSQRFVAILNKKIPFGRLTNALGHMTAGISGKVGDPANMHFIEYKDKDGGSHPAISHFPFIVLSAENSNQIRKVRQEAMKRGIAFNDFTSSMTVGSSADQVSLTATTAEADLEYYGICLFGKTEELKEFTGKFSLFK